MKLPELPPPVAWTSWMNGPCQITKDKYRADSWASNGGDVRPLYTADQLRTYGLATLEAAAKVADAYEPRCDVCPSGCSNAIRAMGKEVK